MNKQQIKVKFWIWGPVTVYYCITSQVPKYFFQNHSTLLDSTYCTQWASYKWHGCWLMMLGWIPPSLVPSGGCRWSMHGYIVEIMSYVFFGLKNIDDLSDFRGRGPRESKRTKRGESKACWGRAWRELLCPCSYSHIYCLTVKMLNELVGPLTDNISHC